MKKNESSEMNLAACQVSDDVLRLIPMASCLKYQTVPINIVGEKLQVATAAPEDIDALDYLRASTGFDLEILSVSKKQIENFIGRYAGKMEDHSSAMLDFKKFVEENPDVTKIVDALFAHAMKMGASDVHLEPQRDGLYVRFRIDGSLQTFTILSKGLQPSIISRIKIMATMDIAEKRLPQDGQLGFDRSGQFVDLRISTLPSKYGEKIVVRILDKSNMAVGLEDLGFSSVDQSIMESMIEKSHGLLLVTGPTGSGKTTTLYSCVQKLRSPLKNIITLEDPIEYELLSNSSNEMGITQVQMNQKIGLTFAKGLRSALRQDPDIIMVGEIRDKETAEVAMQSSMTGHLVMSTLHTNDAPSTLERLKDMGIDSYLIVSTVIGILAQRLVRVLCPGCKEKYNPPMRSLQSLYGGRMDVSKASFFRAKGCESCGGSGYHGRRGVFELLEMNDALKSAVANNVSLAEFKALAKAQGFKTIRESGLDLVAQGLTTVEEVWRVTND